MKEFKSIWKEMARNKQVKAVDVFQYSILRAMVAKNPDKDAVALGIMQRAFTEVTNVKKLTNGQRPYQAVASAVQESTIDRLRWKGALKTNVFYSMMEFEHEFMQFWRIADSILKKLYDHKDNYYIYVIVRTDIDPVYQSVQACHASLKAGFYLANEFPPDTFYISLLGVKDEDELEGTIEYLTSCGYESHEFREPDLRNQLTAVASSPVKSNKRHFMKRYKALRFPFDMTKELS